MSLLNKARRSAAGDTMVKRAVASNEELFGFGEGQPRIMELPIDRLRPNPDQPRKLFDETELRELADSIQRHGLKQPILVKAEAGGSYMILAGERRYRAHLLLKRETIFAIPTDGDADEIGLIENLQRADLTPLEEAAALSRLKDRHGYTEAELGKVIGRSQPDVNKTLALLALHPVIIDEYPAHRDRASKSMLKELAMVADGNEQLRLWQKVKAGLTVRQLQESKAAGRQAERVGEGAAKRLPSARIVAHACRSFQKAAEQAAEQVQVIRAHHGALTPEQKKGLRKVRDLLTQLVDD
jgi:ParB family chromosome partitioning protein